ncbi:MAG: type II toxin-antitoxin system RelE/ParE family toxin [Desulfomonile tiedjei]|nr:type II toxin-antitoxin system RelE/ParE family toxin [Desulfomonile tiedjei]
MQGRFAKDVKRVKDKEILRQALEIIEAIESAPSLSDIPNLKKLSVEGRYFRERVGDHRIGLAIDGGTVTFVRVLNRRDIYRYFP